MIEPEAEEAHLEKRIGERPELGELSWANARLPARNYSTAVGRVLLVVELSEVSPSTRTSPG
jgi:hypothetical protein